VSTVKRPTEVEIRQRLKGVADPETEEGANEIYDGDTMDTEM
jgi:hypothetical protein